MSEKTTKDLTKHNLLVELMNEFKVGQWIKIDYRKKSKINKKCLIHMGKLKFLQKNGFIKLANLKYPNSIPEGQEEVVCILQEQYESMYPSFVFKIKEYITPEMERKALMKDLMKIIPDGKMTNSLKERIERIIGSEEK